MKHAFQTVFPNARKSIDSLGGPIFKLKNVMACHASQAMIDRGWTLEGRHDGTHGADYGLTNGIEHIMLSDWGKPPYRLGDTHIRLQKLTHFRDHKRL
jgi:hypothetical protein